MNHRLLLTVALLLAVPAAASAHGIGVEARLKGDRVHVEAFFDDDTPAADAKVAVTGEDGKAVAEGKADAKGLWSFPVPAAGKYRVLVDAGGGHLAKTTITIPPRPEGIGPPATGVVALEEAPPPPELVVSDGPTRAQVTEGRWLMAGVGLAVIGLLTWGVRGAARWNARRHTTGVSP